MPAEPGIYIEALKVRLLSDELVQSFDILREEVTPLKAYFRVRCMLTNDDMLESATYLEIRGEELVLADYRHQWMTPDHTLQARWDAAPHYPDLPGAPHHIHDGSEENVHPGHPMYLENVLDAIAEHEGNPQ
jgi:hypothetical protein